MPIPKLFVWKGNSIHEGQISAEVDRIIANLENDYAASATMSLA